MLPVLRAVGDGEPRKVADIRDAVATTLGLTPEDLAQRIPSGSPLFNNRVHLSDSAQRVDY